jgi:hypothetical protein
LNESKNDWLDFNTSIHQQDNPSENPSIGLENVASLFSILPLGMYVGTKEDTEEDQRLRELRKKKKRRIR